MHAAVDLGITLFDTADVYGRGMSEEYLGQALGSRRSKVLIATKFGGAMGSGPSPEGGGTRDAIMYAVEESLRRLKTDVIDLYQYQRPDGVTPAEETLQRVRRTYFARTSSTTAVYAKSADLIMPRVPGPMRVAASAKEPMAWSY